MAFAESEAKAFLMDLVKKPEFPAHAIANVYKEVITFHNEMFPAEAADNDFKKKKRRRASQTWPVDVSHKISSQRAVNASVPIAMESDVLEAVDA